MVTKKSIQEQRLKAIARAQKQVTQRESRFEAFRFEQPSRSNYNALRSWIERNHFSREEAEGEMPSGLTPAQDMLFNEFENEGVFEDSDMTDEQRRLTA